MPPVLRLLLLLLALAGADASEMLTLGGADDLLPRGAEQPVPTSELAVLDAEDVLSVETVGAVDPYAEVVPLLSPVAADEEAEFDPTINDEIKAEQAAEAAAQQDKLARARAKIDAMHASLARKAEEKAPAGATKMKRVTGGRSKVGEMDGLRAGLLSNGDVEENGDDKIARMVQEQREKAKAQRDAARARRNNVRGTRDDGPSPADRDRDRQQERYAARRLPDYDPALERQRREALQGERQPAPSSGEPGKWFMVDDGGEVAYRSRPDMDARTGAVAPARALVFAARQPQDAPGWIMTKAGLWLPRTFLLPVERAVTDAEAAAAHAAHAAAAQAAGIGALAPESPAPTPMREPVAATPAPAGCEDGDWKCSIWASSGECTVDEAFMSVHCPKACGLCTPDADAPVAKADPVAAAVQELYAKEVASQARAPEPTPPPPPAPSPPTQTMAPTDAMATPAAVPPVAAPARRRSLSSRPTRLPPPTLEQELAGTRRAAPKLDTAGQGRLETRDAGLRRPSGADGADLPSSLAEEREWLRAQKRGRGAAEPPSSLEEEKEWLRAEKRKQQGEGQQESALQAERRKFLADIAAKEAADGPLPDLSMAL